MGNGNYLEGRSSGLKDHSGIFLDELRETTNSLSQD
jgi:hypothetical protein